MSPRGRSKPPAGRKVWTLPGDRSTVGPGLFSRGDRSRLQGGVAQGVTVFEAINRLVQKPAPYAREVATVLLKDGFDPQALDEMKTLGSFSQGSRIFRLLAEQKLSPADAAFAIRMACHLYQSTRQAAEAQGWPLRRPSPRLRRHPPHEAYFLELLAEAADTVRFTG